MTNQSSLVSRTRWLILTPRSNKPHCVHGQRISLNLNRRLSPNQPGSNIRRQQADLLKLTSEDASH